MNVDRLLRRAFVGTPVAVGSLSAQAAAVRAATGHAPHFALWQYAFAGALGLIASLPAGAGPMGILTPPAEGVPSAAQALGASLRSLASAPARAKAAREERRWRQTQEFIKRDAVKIAGELIKTGEFVMTPLGLAPAHPAPAAPVAPSVPQGGKSCPMPAPGYGYQADAPAPELAPAAPRTLADASAGVSPDAPQPVPPAPVAPGLVSAAEARDAFNQPQG